MTANEFNAALLAGGTFVYLVGWLPDPRKRMDGGDISELHLVAKLAMEAQEKQQACLTQRCLRRGVDGGRFSRQFCNVSWLSLGWFQETHRRRKRLCLGLLCATLNA